MITSLVLMTLDHRQQHLETIRAGLSFLVYPLQYVVNIPAEVGGWASTNLTSHEQLQQENERLQQEHLLLQVRLQKFAALEAENARLRRLLQSSRKVGERVLVAELLAVDFDPFKRQALINKGSMDGVFQGHPLLDADGVMGQVVHVAPTTSTIMLLTDPSHAIPVQVNRTGLRAVAMGTGAPDELELPHIPNSADLEVGDLLISSGLGQRFPRGYPVARVTLVQRDPREPYARVVATPTAELERIREVLLVWPQVREESES